MFADKPVNAHKGFSALPDACAVALLLAPSILAVTTFATHSSPSNYLGFAVPILCSEAIFVLLAMLSGMRIFSALLRLQFRTLAFTFCWILSIILVAFFSAPNPKVAQVFLPVIMLHALFSLALADRLNSSWSEFGSRFLIAAGFGAAAFCVLTYGMMWTVRKSDTFDWLTVGIGVSNVRQLAFYGLTSAAVGAGLIASEEPNGTQERPLLSFLLVSIGSGMCFWSGGRAGVGGLGVAIVVAVALAPTELRFRAVLRLLAASGTGLLISNVWIPDARYGVSRIFEATFANSDGLNGFTSNRLLMWQQSLELISARPLLGYGLGQFKFLVPSAMNTFTHPHNSLIQFLFQWGIIGTAAVVFMILPAFRKIGSIFKGEGIVSEQIALSLLAGHFSMSLIEGNLFHVYPMSIVALALATLASARVKEPPELGALPRS